MRCRDEFKILILWLACLISLQGQSQQLKTVRVGLFVPLWLDSAFSETGEYRHGKTFPKQSIAGLEFYQGVEYALDSLRQQGNGNIELRVFDIRSREGNISLIARSPFMDSLHLIIGQVSGNEYLRLAELARARRIPFVSASYPNDGGVRENPYVLITNAKLNSHLQVLYNHLRVRLQPTDNVIWLRRYNPADNRIADVFKEFSTSAGVQAPRYKVVNVVDTFSELHLYRHLDSTRQNVLIAGSLDEGFGLRLATNCLLLSKSYQVSLIGMPTWEGIQQLRTPDYRQLTIDHTAGFYRPSTDIWGLRMEEWYRKRTFSKPSDVAFKAYQATYHFVSILQRHQDAWAQHLNDPELKSMTDYDFRPIRWNPGSALPDYFENKRIYLVRRQNGLLALLN